MEHSEIYRDDVNTFLKRGEFNNEQVGICFCAMQNLSVAHYVSLCNLILSLFDNDKLPEQLLENSIDPDFLHKRIIVNNYQLPVVIKLITALKDDKKIMNSDFKKRLPDILSGKSSKELKQFDDEN